MVQALSQQFGKEMVIAVPAALVVQGNDEQVGTFELFQRDIAPVLRREIPSRPFPPALAPAESVTMTFNAKATAAGIVTNQAVVTSAEVELTPLVPI